MERDPVCGQVINLTDMKETSVYKRSRYFFCCPICRKLFDEDPAIYADKEEMEFTKLTFPQLKLFN